MGRADLHTHSIYSDGLFSPEEIILRAIKLGLEAISITDHDCIGAIEPALAFCNQYDIEFVPGIEISSYYGNKELHFLGYFFDYKNKILKEYVAFFLDERKKRAVKIVNCLNKMGVKINLELLMKKAHPGSIGRPHIAHVMVEEGYVLSYHEAFYKYIGDDCPCNVAKFKIAPAEVIKIINQAGGISFIAHPGLELNEGIISPLVKLGLEGIETVHPCHSADKIEYYRKLIKKYNLLECGGSDCHGNSERYPILGKVSVPYHFVTKMKKWLDIKSKKD